MLHTMNKIESNTEELEIFLEDNKMPSSKLNEDSISPRTAYELIKNELIDEGNARQNLATFCQTNMEEEATLLMSETLAVNAIDKSEYPKMAEIENRCVNIIANLWNAKPGESIGTSTVGSSEACMLAGLAMKFRWRAMATDIGLDINAKKPNIVISSAYQVCWEKFCVYWDIELRAVPIDSEHMSINTDKVMEYVDDYTIGIVGILGITYTGKFDDIEKLDELVEQYNQSAKIPIGIHVDGASGAMFVPFIDKDLVWDFRLNNVHSINTSGHKYGLVYPGVGWVLWKDKSLLPSELIFSVNYLGGEEDTMAINFSRSGSQIIAQYYVFLRYGFQGMKTIQEHTKNIAMYLAQEIQKLSIFEIYNNGENIPIVCYKLLDEHSHSWSLYDLADRLAMKGWQVPAYTLPENMKSTVIQRVVVRADFFDNMARSFVDDFKEAVNHLELNGVTSKKESGTQGFTH